MTREEFKQRIEDAANRALHESEEVRALYEAMRDVGFDFEVTLTMNIFERVTEDWLTALYQLQDRRKP